jgi:calcium binding protein
MAKSKRDPVREERIHEEITVDAYGPEEQSMGWYYYLEDKIRFPFKAKCVISNVISPLQKVNLSTFWIWRLRIHARATCSCSSAGRAETWLSRSLN